MVSGGQLQPLRNLGGAPGVKLKGNAGHALLCSGSPKASRSLGLGPVALISLRRPCPVLEALRQASKGTVSDGLPSRSVPAPASASSAFRPRRLPFLSRSRQARPCPVCASRWGSFCCGNLMSLFASGWAGLWLLCRLSAVAASRGRSLRGAASIGVASVLGEPGL